MTSKEYDCEHENHNHNPALFCEYDDHNHHKLDENAEHDESGCKKDEDDDFNKEWGGGCEQTIKIKVMTMIRTIIMITNRAILFI
jgi:hypothetical protein